MLDDNEEKNFPNNKLSGIFKSSSSIIEGDGLKACQIFKPSKDKDQESKFFNSRKGPPLVGNQYKSQAPKYSKASPNFDEENVIFLKENKPEIIIDEEIKEIFTKSDKWNPDLDKICSECPLSFSTNRKFPSKWKFIPLPEIKKDQLASALPFIKKCEDEEALVKNEDIPVINLELQGDLIHRCFASRPWKINPDGTRTLINNNEIPEVSYTAETDLVKQEIDWIKSEFLKDEDLEFDGYSSEDDEQGMMNFLHVDNSKKNFSSEEPEVLLLNYMEPYKKYNPLAKKEENPEVPPLSNPDSVPEIEEQVISSPPKSPVKEPTNIEEKKISEKLVRKKGIKRKANKFKFI